MLLRAFFFFLLLFSVASGASPSQPSVADYGSIQEAIDANRSRMVFVPAGDYTISTKLRIHGKNGGLFGPGRVIQTSDNQPILEVEHAEGVQVRDLTLTRAEGKMDTANEGVLAMDCRDLVLENVRVIDNRTRAAAISLRDCKGARITHCLVRNYMRLSIDDRTTSPDWGYAFNCTDGTGISVNTSTGTLIEGNHVVEDHMVPTPEIKKQYKLGDFVKRAEKKGAIISQQAWDAGYTDAWQQGSGIIVTAPETTDFTRLIGNHIENAAQGIDIHSDHVIISQNIIEDAFIGMKAMHGSRNVLITGNQFSRNCLWAIGLMPGAAANANNADGASIVANNIISDFGYGKAHWIWGDERSPFKFDNGQQPDDPPLTDVIIQGNLVQSIGTPRYKYAVVIPKGPNAPRGLHFSNNLFHPGTKGVANIELPP